MAVLPLTEAHDLAVRLHRSGNLRDAESVYRQILTVLPDHVETLRMLSELTYHTGRFAEALEHMKRAAAIRPDFASLQNNLGLLLAGQGEFDEAIEAFQRALAIHQDFPEAWTNLGNALLAQLRMEEAIAAYRAAVALRPDYAVAVHNLSGALIEQGQIDEAIEKCRQSLSLRCDSENAYRVLGRALRESGRLDESIACYHEALSICPSSKIYGDMLFTELFHPAYDRRRLFDEAAKWNQLYARPLGQSIAPYANDRSPERKLRIAYYSCDLGNHPLGRFTLPLLGNHDHDQFEVFSYCDLCRDDHIADALRSHVDVWHKTRGMSDPQVAELVRQDRIDILIDLSMQTNGNRMLMLARKPAPVQISYLAYCGTTGCQTVDYRLTDRFLEPPEWDGQFSSEQRLRLPNSFWCYQPPPDMPDVQPPPAQTNGQITFGCLNDFAKVTSNAIETWCRLLRRVEGSRLIIHSKEGSHRQRVIDQLSKEQIDAQRLEFAGFMPTRKYFDCYNRIDIALDSFPYAGGTTSCDALWMGVPLVSLAGQTGVARGGLSILSNIGLADLVASDVEQYLQIASDLANDLSRCTQLRSTMRDRMQSSPLMNAPQFARDVEALYRKVWRKWSETVDQTGHPLR